MAQVRRPKTDVYNLGSDVLFDCAFSPADALTIVNARCTNAMLNPEGPRL